MGITPDFLIKHVRPLGEAGCERYFSNDLMAYVTDQLGLDPTEFIYFIHGWREVALKDPAQDWAEFVAAAQVLADARWSELYSTSASTVMFLDDAQLASLSAHGEEVGANAAFAWSAPSPIAIVVTVHNGAEPEVAVGAEGFQGETDGNSDVVHFSALT